MLSSAFGRLIAGPVGSGKTHGVIIELLRRSAQQHPGDDGLRHTRWAIVRQTLKQIKDTIVPDIERICLGIALVRVSDSSIRIWWGDVRCTVLLIPLEDLVDQGRLLSSQLTGVWMSECIEVDINLIGPISGRIGRYPSGAHGVPTWSGIIADTNFPVEGSDWHEFMENPPPTWQIFKQPGGLTPLAENLPWLYQTEETRKLPEDDPIRIQRGREYYLRLKDGSSKEYVNRYVDAQYGPDPSGSAVFKESFDRSVHVVPSLEPVPQKPLLIGQDFGRNPCQLICQIDHRGTLLILEEVMNLEMGLELALRTRLRPTLMDIRYLGRPIVVIGDPAGRAKSSIFEMNDFDMLTNAGFAAFPAPTNDIEPRLQAMEAFLNRRNGVLIDASRCPTVVQGFSGSYKFEKMRSGELKPKPSKVGRWSHPMDCGQYVALVANSPGAYQAALGQLRNSTRPKTKAPAVAAWT
jgi:hypothetical protein